MSKYRTEVNKYKYVIYEHIDGRLITIDKNNIIINTMFDSRYDCGYKITRDELTKYFKYVCQTNKSIK